MPPQALRDRWPYPPREWEPNLAARAGQKLPGLGGGWTIHLGPETSLTGAAVPLSGAFGRGGIFRLGDVVLRPYRRGGLVRYLNRSTYSGTNRFQREFEVHGRLYQAGFPTVEPLGFAFRRRGLGWQGVFLTRWLAAAPWPADWSLSATLLPALGVAIRALSEGGYWAPDLNATNVLVTPAGAIQLLDWDRTTLVSPGGLIPAYKARMLRSLQKLGAPSDVVAEFTELL